MSYDHPIRLLYEQILIAWNQQDAAAMAVRFEEDGNIVGFDGSQADSRAAIEDHLRPIFADHPTAAYVAIVREIRMLGRDVGLLRAVVGMIPPNSDDINPAGNTIQTLVAIQNADGWQAALFQSTPAAWHGRPQDSAALTEELRDVMRHGLTCR
ncbi:MAG TPA: SgcJ/EcaC family oxidoreductase [Rubrobacter sp.]|nr:SgcJ/EcaC family oxidoreductase [Rubrobacter sp.]